MKHLLLSIFFLLQISLFAQKNCEYTKNVTDSLGTYKMTEEYMIYEGDFARNKNYIFFSLVNNNGIPLLNLLTVQKSADFIKANCMDAKSKIYLQLVNGKIVTLLHTSDENCGSMLRNASETKYTRVNHGTFMFVEGSIEDLKSSPVTLMKIKYSFGTADYEFRKQFVSEFNRETYYPETYFIDYLKCIE